MIITHVLNKKMLEETLGNFDESVKRKWRYRVRESGRTRHNHLLYGVLVSGNRELNPGTVRYTNCNQ